ncbi:hypothetical protein [Paractinoplanes maris]|uniref:hypothetical protein n=1 Tax=Paractinoplanes maris TaxID=1734446 RepID=UPI00202115A4|nr:hypothetical protein [Actinoplanes maris]
MHPQVRLNPGEVLHIDGEASVQFAGARALTFRLIRVDARSTYDGWLWLEGYVLSATGVAMQRRRVFVRRDGLRTAAVNGRG